MGLIFSIAAGVVLACFILACFILVILNLEAVQTFIVRAVLACVALAAAGALLFGTLAVVDMVASATARDWQEAAAFVVAMLVIFTPIALAWWGMSRWNARVNRRAAAAAPSPTWPKELGRRAGRWLARSLAGVYR